MATHANTIWTLAVVKAYLGSPSDDTTLDTQIEQVADAISAQIERYTGRQFVTRAVTETLDGDGRDIVQLTHTPVTALTTLTIVRAEGESAETILSTAYTLNTARGRVRLYAGDAFTTGFANVSVTYSAGYGAQGASTLPRDIYQAGLEMVKQVCQTTNYAGSGATNISVDGHNFTPRNGWPLHIQQVLDSWRRPGL